VNVIDSSAWLSYFAGDANSGYFASAIEDSAGLLIPSITLAEVSRSFSDKGERNRL
jgi:predicted nucleic acid-binding protein